MRRLLALLALLSLFSAAAEAQTRRRPRNRRARVASHDKRAHSSQSKSAWLQQFTY
jgi:hypothetical protein